VTKFAIAVLAAITTVQPALSAAGDQPTDCEAKPSSFVPHLHTNHHVYGAPIQPAIVRHSGTSHHKQTSHYKQTSRYKHAPKKHSSSAAIRGKQA
jgi:hypothetical protein